DGAARPRMLDHVRERLLDDPKGRKLEACGKLDPVSRLLQVDLDPHGARVRDQSVDVAQPWLRRERRVALIEQLEQPPHLGKRLAGAAFCRQQTPASSLL